MSNVGISKDLLLHNKKYHGDNFRKRMEMQEDLE
jgi:hypothetical protein